MATFIMQQGHKVDMGGGGGVPNYKCVRTKCESQFLTSILLTCECLRSCLAMECCLVHYLDVHPSPPPNVHLMSTWYYSRGKCSHPRPSSFFATLPLLCIVYFCVVYSKNKKQGRPKNKLRLLPTFCFFLVSVQSRVQLCNSSIVSIPPFR